MAPLPLVESHDLSQDLRHIFGTCSVKAKFHDFYPISQDALVAKRARDVALPERVSHVESIFSCSSTVKGFARDGAVTAVPNMPFESQKGCLVVAATIHHLMKPRVEYLRPQESSR